MDRTCGGKMPFTPPLTFEEAMAWTGVKRSTLYTLAAQGVVGRKVGHKWYFSQAELLRVFTGQGTDEGGDAN